MAQDANAVSLHVQKKQVDLAAHKAKKQFDNSEKVKKDKKQKASKEARLEGIQGGDEFEDDLFSEVRVLGLYRFNVLQSHNSILIPSLCPPSLSVED